MEAEQGVGWKMNVTVVSMAIQCLRYRGVTHKDVLLLTSTIKRHHDFEQAKFCSMKPGLTMWTSRPGDVRAAFYSCTADCVIAAALRGFRERQINNQTTDLMLRRATDIMAEVAGVISAGLLIGSHTELRVPVAKTNRKVRGIKKIVELGRRRDTMAVHKATMDRRQRLHALRRGASTHAELVRNGQGGGESLPGRTCAGENADDTGTRAV